MAYDLSDAGLKRLPVSVDVHGRSGVMGMVDAERLRVAEILAGDVPAVMRVIGLKRDSEAPFGDDREVVPVDGIEFFDGDHALFLLPLVFRVSR